METRRHIPPSRRRYEAKCPVLTIRVPREDKDNFNLICTRTGFSARLLFNKLLNCYTKQNQQQTKQIDKTTPIIEKQLYKIVDVPFSIEAGLVRPEGWEGPLPVKDNITSDKNKIKILTELGFKFEEIKETF